MWSKFLQKFRDLPLLGPLADCRRRDHSETLKQTIITLIFTLAPIWWGGLVLFSSTEQNFWAACQTTYAHGEFLMLGTALLVPIFWTALEDPPGAKSFPSRLGLIVVVCLLELVGSGLYGIVLAGHVRQPFISRTSMFLFALSLAILYLGTAYHSSRLPNAGDEIRRGEDDFIRSYEEHRQ